MIARFELRIDEETGRRYWFGSEDGWKDATEVGENGTLTMSADHFDVGTVLELWECDEAHTMIEELGRKNANLVSSLGTGS